MLRVPFDMVVTQKTLTPPDLGEGGRFCLLFCSDNPVCIFRVQYGQLGLQLQGKGKTSLLASGVGWGPEKF